MKKLCDKMSKPQWRITVPNVNKSILKKSARNSGCYDLEQAQRDYNEKSASPVGEMFVANDISTDSDSGDEKFEDARGSQKNSEINVNASENDFLNSNADKELETHYDVPRITFSFLANKAENGNNESKSENAENIYANEQTSVTVKTEITVDLEPPTKNEDLNVPQKRESVEIFPVVGILKCGSDPSFVIHRKNDTDDYDNDDDGLYKVPRVNTKWRLSQSLSNFNVEEFQPYTSDHTSIEHISCSQILPQEEEQNDTEKSEVDLRSKLQFKLKKPDFFTKPNKAITSWNNFRNKFNNMMVEQAAQQRVGAYSDNNKLRFNFEEVYNASKIKCKNAFKSTTKVFKKNSESIDSDKEKNDVKAGFTAEDIEYKLNLDGDNKVCDSPTTSKICDVNEGSSEKNEWDSSIFKAAFRRSKFSIEGQNGFDDLRRYVKQGGDFCKELATILQERAEAETQYAKNLSKLSSKLARACRDGVGGLNEAWKAVAVELECRAEAHKLLGQTLLDETAKPLRTLTETQHRSRKQCENTVDKAAKSLADWRATEAKTKKQSHVCSRENEKLQDAAVLDTSRAGKLTLSRSTSFIQLPHIHNKNVADKENTKLEGKKRKAEDAVKKADIEYYNLCVRSERARLEWDSAVLHGVNTFQLLEEERLCNLKTVLTAYLHNTSNLSPRLIEAIERLKSPVLQTDSGKDLNTFLNLRQSSQQVSEQLLPDFYCEHITLAMNRERRKQALVKLLHLIRQDIERERKSKNGLENLSKAIKQTPNFGAEDSQQSVSEKLYHMKSMLTYLEGARYKLQNALAELDSKPKPGHPLASHITVTRDKSGLQQSVLKVPQWLKDEWFESDKSPINEKPLSVKSHGSDNSDPHNNDIADTDWVDRGAADGNSNQLDSDFDEFSSEYSSPDNICVGEECPVQPIAKCKALYPYTPNLTDELALQPGDLLSVYRQQDDGWWLGECKGNVGIFPATYVELINSS